MAPMFERVHNGTYTTSNGTWWWPVIFLVGQAPAAMMNVIQEKFQENFKTKASGTNKRFSILYFQFVESFYQMVFMTNFWWFDILPNYGTSVDAVNFGENYRFGWQCFFGTDGAIAKSDRCHGYCAGIGMLFISFYMLSYIFGTGLTLFRSANLLSMAQSVSPVMSMVFWYAFPAVNSFAQGTNYPLHSFDGWANIVAMPLIVVGAFIYRHYESESRDPDAEELTLRRGPIELCCSVSTDSDRSTSYA